jgi:predicted NUDIX family NTP pyrophosphohydrolase
MNNAISAGLLMYKIDEKELLSAAIREFKKETGIEPNGEFESLGWVKQKSGKTIYAWAFEYFGDEDMKM